MENVAENLTPLPDSAYVASDAGELLAGVPQERPAALALLRGAVLPWTRTSGFYASAWRTYLTRDGSGELPVVRPTVSLATQAFRDELVLAGFRMLRPVSDVRAFRQIEQEVSAALDMYAEAGWLSDPEAFHRPPPTLTDRDVKIRRVSTARHPYHRVSYESGYEPYAGEPGGGRWLDYAANHRVRAWMLRHEEPRPWLVNVHGAAMGRPGIDQAIFRARWAHEQLGLNVVQPVLPLHGPRGRDLPKGAGFPGEDMLDNLHGTAQAVWDIRRLISWIREQDPEARIGMNSISLGGYITSLVASLDDRLTCAILGVPVANLVGLVETHAGLAPGDRRLRTVELAKQLCRVVSPLALTPRVPYEGRFIYAGLADRLVHPREQVARLWEHWGRPEIAWYEGGHTGFFRSRPVQRFVEDALLASRLVRPSGRSGTVR